MASSSFSPQARSIISAKLYDVFISHRGPDVKQTLAKQLFDLLQARGLRAFLDCEEIEGGDPITVAIHNAICSSRVQIAIFSKGFAESSWCLNEVVLMLQQTDALFIPVFYGVEPWELRYIDHHTDSLSHHNSQYAKAFHDYRSKGRNLDKLDEWKRALASAADISGYELGHYQEDLFEKVVSRVVEVVQDKEKSTPLHVAKYPVGLDELVQDFEMWSSRTAGMVGIFGLGGSGKTTLAKELFNKKRPGYHASCFLSDVRESYGRRELHSLQSQLLTDLLSKEKRIRSVDHGIGKLEYHLGRAMHLRFLIVVDDIDHQDQLDALLPQGILGCGSLVIITTRDQSLLMGVDVRYEMNKMGECDAKELFCSHAFGRRDPPDSVDASYQKLVDSFVEYCGGLPLSLIVLGAHVYGRDEYYWNLELEKVKKIPPTDIMERLKISFNGLDRDEKQIFIDIACFFNKKYLYDFINIAITIWKASGWSSCEHALETLQDKCLIKINPNGTFEMHDHLRDLGREMGDELDPARLWQPELLRSMEEKGFEKTLAETKGRCFHSCWDSFLGTKITYFIAHADLVFLEIGMVTDNIPRIPSAIPLQKLHCLRIYGAEDLLSSFEEQLETHAQATFQLRLLHILSSPSQKLRNLIEMLRNLEELRIFNSLENTETTSLVQSLKQLSNLRSLSLETEGGLFRGDLDLSKGRSSCTSSRMDSLENIQLLDLPNVLKLVISEEMCPKLEKLDIECMENLKEIELKGPGRLNTLWVHDCWKLETITITGLQVFNVNKFAGLKVVDRSRVEHIWISGCPELQSVQRLEELPRLKSLLIEVPDNTNAWAANYIRGLTRLTVKQTILLQEATERSSTKLNSSLFSEVIDFYAVSHNTQEMKSSSSAIIIYVLLVTPLVFNNSYIAFGCGDFYLLPTYGSCGDWLISVVLTQHDSEVSLKNVRINVGFKVEVEFGEEKALIVLRKIVDELYMGSTVQNLPTYDMEKGKQKLY